MNEMIQEAVLDSIESIDDAQLFAEYEVLSALAATYMKSAMIQEASTGLDFDGYEIVQEYKGEKGIETVTSEKDGTYSSVGKPSKKYKTKQGILSKILGWIKSAVRRIREAIGGAFKKLFKRKGFTKYELANIGGNGGKLIPKTEKGREIVEEIKSGKVSDYHNDYVSLNDVMVEFAISFPVRGLVIVAKNLEEIAGMYEKASQEYQNKDNTSHKTIAACQSAVEKLKKMNIDNRSKDNRTVPYPEIHQIWQESDERLKNIESRIDKARAYFDSYKDSVYETQYQYNQAANPDKKAKWEANAQAESFTKFINTANSIMAEVNKWLKKSTDLKKAMDDCITKQRAAKKAQLDQTQSDIDYEDEENKFIPGGQD
jgi:hypothetical protein